MSHHEWYSWFTDRVVKGDEDQFCEECWDQYNDARTPEGFYANHPDSPGPCIPVGQVVWSVQVHPSDWPTPAFTTYCTEHAHWCPVCQKGRPVSCEYGSGSCPPADYSVTKFSCGHTDSQINEWSLEDC